MKGRGNKSNKERASYDFTSKIRGKKLPLLILDEKWLELFEIGHMPKEVRELQDKLRKLVVRQGKINDELAGFKRYKSQLLQEIVENMGVDDSSVGILKARKMEKNQKLVSEINEKIALHEELLDGMPEEMQRVNEDLLIASSGICYSKLIDQVEAVRELNQEIEELNGILMKKLLEKQGHETGIHRMYTYMHNMYGPDITEALDIANEDILNQ